MVDRVMFGRYSRDGYESMKEFEKHVSQMIWRKRFDVVQLKVADHQDRRPVDKQGGI